MKVMSRFICINRKFVYDGNGQILCEYDANNDDVLLRTNIWAGGAATFIANAVTDIFYYSFGDAYNSIYNIIDASGDLQNKYDYTSFGEPYQWSAPTIPNVFTFNSSEFNPETSSYFTGFDYYNPSLDILCQTSTENASEQPQTQTQSKKERSLPQPPPTNTRSALGLSSRLNPVTKKYKHYWGIFTNEVNLSIKKRENFESSRIIYILIIHQEEWTKTWDDKGNQIWGMRTVAQKQDRLKEISTFGNATIASDRGYHVIVDMDTTFKEWKEYGKENDTAGLLASGHGRYYTSEINIATNYTFYADFENVAVPASDMHDPWSGNFLHFSIFTTCYAGGLLNEDDWIALFNDENRETLSAVAGFDKKSLGWYFSKNSITTYAWKGTDYRGDIGFAAFAKQAFQYEVNKLPRIDKRRGTIWNASDCGVAWDIIEAGDIW